MYIFNKNLDNKNSCEQPYLAQLVSSWYGMDLPVSVHASSRLSLKLLRLFFFLTYMWVALVNTPRYFLSFEHFPIFFFTYFITEYVLIEAQALIDAHHPAAKNTSYRIHTKCLIKHQKIIEKQSKTLKLKRYCSLAAAHAQITTSL